MQVNIKELLKNSGIEESFYPGKRIIKKMPQAGEYKSHCAVFDWRSSDLLRIDIKAGLSGRDMVVKDLKKFPISFQSPTYIEIDTSSVANENADDEDEDEEGKGKSSGGGKGQKKKKPRKTLADFSKMVEGKIPDLGEVTKLVVMGKEIAKNAMEAVMGALVAQIKNLTVTPVNILASAHAVNVSVAEPGGGLAPKGNETTSYKYKGADMFGFAEPTPGR